jgi:acetoin:2,6-dichlorophenolindophenol oxidoreductase subunit beta
MAEDMPDKVGPIPFGKAKIRREGTDVTIIGTQLMVGRALEAAETLAKEGISAEVIDLRTLAPLDSEAILESVAKTNRLVIAEEAVASAGWGGDIVSLVADQGIYYLEAPVKRVNMGKGLVAYSPPLEDFAIPSSQRIIEAAREVMQN